MITREQADRLYDIADKLIAKGGRSSNSAFAFVHGKDVIYRPHAPCCAALNYPKILAREMEAVVNVIQYNSGYASVKEWNRLKPFITWMLKESPYSSIFLRKNCRDVYDHGYLIDTKASGDLIASAMMSMRMPTEFPETFRAWEVLVKSGVNKSLAFVIAHGCTFHESTGLHLGLLHERGHVPFNLRGMTVPSTRNFVNKVFRKGIPYRERGRYSNVSGMFKGQDAQGECLSNLISVAHNKGRFKNDFAPGEGGHMPFLRVGYQNQDRADIPKFVEFLHELFPEFKENS